MPAQDNNVPRNQYQNKILDLEKKYFRHLEKIVTSSEFQNDLLLIEKETQENYPKYKDVWKIKDKIKIPAERVIRQHIYMYFHDYIKGIYPSPISSDLGIRFEDAVVCVDAKTIDTNGNSGDLRSTSVEMNQNSFLNKNYPYIKTQSNLESIDHYSRLPVLTYIIKIVYHDDNYSFKLERSPYPSIVLVCVPNGEISSLFDFNIIDNFKTYDYFKETDGQYYKTVEIPNIHPRAVLDEWMKNEFENRRHWQRVHTTYFSSNKYIYYDPYRTTLWWETSIANKKVIAPVKSGGSVRYNNSIMKERYDSQNNRWDGYKEYQLPPSIVGSGGF